MPKKNPILLDELIETAEFYILNQKYSEAAKVLKDTVEIDEANPLLHYLYGLALEGTNDFENAKREFRRALELDPEHTEAKDHLDRLVGQ